MNISFQKAARKALITGMAVLGTSCLRIDLDMDMDMIIDMTGTYECTNAKTNERIQFKGDDLKSYSSSSRGTFITFIDPDTGAEVDVNSTDGWCDCTKVGGNTNSTPVKATFKINGR